MSGKQPSIEAIIFDLGRVIIDVDFSKSIEAFAKLGITDVASIMWESHREAFFEQFESGSLSEREFLNLVREISGLSLTDEQIKKAWEAMLGDMPRDRLEKIRKIGQYFSTFLLSNTNPIHQKCIYQYIKEHHKEWSFANLFQKEYYSFEMGMRKPNPEIFRNILNDNQLIAEKTLFLDDSPEHLESAKQLGICTRQVNSASPLVQILEELQASYGLD